MMEWTPEGARERLEAAELLDVRVSGHSWELWAKNYGIPDLDHALAHIATLEAQAQAWEQERAGLVAVIAEAVEELSDHAMQLAWESVSDCHHWDLMVKLKAAIATEAAAGRPTAQEGA